MAKDIAIKLGFEPILTVEIDTYRLDISNVDRALRKKSKVYRQNTLWTK